ncbi:MAG: hypothetical protein N4A38_04235 [Candidatus Gracilibacteria bacterium]|nr:hypothetical protein [Candidatus Gracilibacteria bacterium]
MFKKLKLNKLKKFIKTNYKKIIFGIFILFALSTETTFAATDKSIFGITVEAISEGVKALLEVCFFIAGAFSALVGWLMTVDWTTGTIFGLDSVFRELWIMISNIVYLAFAFILVIIAFMNIIGKGGDNYALKTALPKFIISLIMVPFTWFIVQFFISLSSVLTVSVLTLPTDIIADKAGGTVNQFIKIPKNGWTINVDGIGTPGGLKPKANYEGCSSEEECDYTFGEYLQKNPFGVMYVYLYGVFNFGELTKLDTSSWLSGTVSVFDIIIKIIFNFAFFIVFVVILMGLFLALFMRTAYLWLYTIFSPFFGIMYFFGDGFGGEKLKKFTFKEFISLVLVPVYVAAALSFGLLFISLISTNAKYKSQTVFTEAEPGKTIINIAPVTVTVIGDIFPKSGNQSGDGVNIFARLIMYLFGITILRLSVMAAFKSSSITEAAAAPIIKIGQDVGNLMKKLPQNIPIAPGGLSMKSFEKASEFPKKALETASAKKTSVYEDKLYEMLGAGSTINTAKMVELQQQAQQVNTEASLRALLDELKSLAQKFGRNNPKVRELEKRVLSELQKRDLSFAARELDKSGVTIEQAKKLMDENGKLTRAGARLILGDRRASKVTEYMRMTSGTGAGGGAGSTVKVTVEAWNNPGDEVRVLSGKTKLKETQINHDNNIRLIEENETGKKTIEYIDGGEYTSVELGIVNDLADLTQAQVDELKDLMSSGSYDKYISKILKELFGREVTLQELQTRGVPNLDPDDDGNTSGN